MKKIIAVRGTRNVGKTTSIKMAKDLFIKKYPSANVTVIKNGVDVIVVVEINGIIIIFASAGDTEEILKDLLKKIANIDWDILVCATKGRGKTVTFIEKCAAKCSLIWIEKTSSLRNESSANEETAAEIIRHLV